MHIQHVRTYIDVHVQCTYCTLILQQSVINITHTQGPSFEEETTAPVEGYTLLYMPTSGGSTTTLTFLADVVTATVKELEKGTNYTFSIIARNSAGDGATLTLDPVQTDIDRELVGGRGAGGEGLGERGWGRGAGGERLGERGGGKREEGYTFVDLHYITYMYIVCTCTIILCVTRSIHM